MTEFKVGDRVKLSRKYGGWAPSNEGKTGTITRITHAWTYVTFDNSKGDAFENDYGNPELLKLISRASEIPPATITHEGYTYNRGERVRPEWLKDDNWVVWKRPELMGRKEEIIYIDGPLTKTKCAKTGLITRRTMENMLAEFRPHEPSDYKWGDWAMYEGKKVFVMNEVSRDPVYGHERVCVSHSSFSRSPARYIYVCPDQLTPTHAP